MCSYNAVNGVPSCANDWLLGDLLRNSWEFNGYVTSDCDADSDVFYSHHYTATPEEAVAVILAAGTDVDCGSFMTDNAASALAKGNIVESDIDTVLKRLFKVRIRLGSFDPPTVLNTFGPQDVCNEYALELARDGVRQSVVLVKNTNNVLPLNAASYTSPVVIGPNIDISDITTYYGGAPTCNNSAATALDAIQQHIASATGIKGVPDVGSSNTSGVPAAAAAAAAADLVFLAIGSDLQLEREGHDRLVTNFSTGQLALISAVAAAAKGPVVALVFSGGAMDITPLLNNPQISAVIVCGQPSVQVVGVGDGMFLMYKCFL
jgi:xylan 1,4-beta-xylosidase